MSESVPKVFISYSWTNTERVIELARRLMGDGIDVVLDKWGELGAGQDKYTFMERSVTDPSISRVLMICDKAYAEKANERKGGVGDETMVISPEVYKKATETKYIPVIFERDEHGKAYVPAYLKSRIYIDLCIENEQYEHEYEQLLRELHNKPEYSKPVLGKMPEYLNEESVDFSGVRNSLKQIQAFDGKNRAKVEFSIRRFGDEFIKAMVSFVPTFDDNFDENLLARIDAVKPLRDLYFDYVESLITSDTDTGSLLGNFFEQVYNGLHSREGRGQCTEQEFEFPRFLIWEMFIGTTAILLHYEQYATINAMLTRTYFLRKSPFESSVEPLTFVKFRAYLQYIETTIKPKSKTPNLHTLAGDIAVKREKLPVVRKSTLINADLILYQLSCVYNFPKDLYHHHWFPMLYVYDGYLFFNQQSLWSKMVSKKHCEKLFPLFGVTDISQLKTMIERNSPEHQVQHERALPAPLILTSINPTKIGTLP